MRMRRTVVAALSGAACVVAIAACGTSTSTSVHPPESPPAAPAAPQEPAKTPEQIRAQYGMYPLPISEQEIAQYHVKKKQLKEIKKSQRLVKSKKAKQIRFRESRNNYRAKTGQYGGAWQMNPGIWRGNGGRQFANAPQNAPAFAQDYILWKVVSKVGWTPWHA